MQIPLCATRFRQSSCMGDRGWTPQPESTEIPREIMLLEGVEEPDLRRQGAGQELARHASPGSEFAQGIPGHRRQEAPEEMVFPSHSLPKVFGPEVSRARRSSQEGPRNERQVAAVARPRPGPRTDQGRTPPGGLRRNGPKTAEAKLEVPSGTDSEATAQPAGTPDLERGMEEAPGKGFPMREHGFSKKRRLSWCARILPERPSGRRRGNTGRSNARRSGGWQQCRPPFRVSHFASALEGSLDLQKGKGGDIAAAAPLQDVSSIETSYIMPSGTLPPLAASSFMTALWSQVFISALPSVAPV